MPSDGMGMETVGKDVVHHRQLQSLDNFVLGRALAKIHRQLLHDAAEPQTFRSSRLRRPGRVFEDLVEHSDGLSSMFQHRPSHKDGGRSATCILHAHILLQYPSPAIYNSSLPLQQSLFDSSLKPPRDGLLTEQCGLTNSVPASSPRLHE